MTLNTIYEKFKNCVLFKKEQTPIPLTRSNTSNSMKEFRQRMFPRNIFSFRTRTYSDPYMGVLSR